MLIKTQPKDNNLLSGILAPKCIRINNLLKQDADILYYRQFATQDIQAESRYSSI